MLVHLTYEVDLESITHRSINLDGALLYHCGNKTLEVCFAEHGSHLNFSKRLEVNLIVQAKRKHALLMRFGFVPSQRSCDITVTATVPYRFNDSQEVISSTAILL